jgi:hypothetical protein
MLDLKPLRHDRFHRLLAPLACAALELAATNAPATDAPHPPWRRPLSDAALVALFEHVMMTTDEAVYCLAWDDADAPPAVLRSLQSSGRRVVPASACHKQADTPGSYERSTRRQAEFVELGPFERSFSGAMVPFRTFRHGLWASSGRCHLTAAGEDWHVERCDVEVIS